MVIVARLPCAGEVTGPLWDRAASVISDVGGQSASRGNVAPELVDATPSGNLPGHGTAIGSHSAAGRCGPVNLRLGVASFLPKGEAPQADTGPLLSRVAYRPSTAQGGPNSRSRSARPAGFRKMGRARLK